MQESSPNKRPLLIMLSIFSIAFCILLSGSYIFVLPQLAQVQIGATVYSTQQLADRESTLQNQIEALEAKRTSLMQPVQNPLYATLVQSKQEQVSAATRLNEINTVVERFYYNSIGTIVLTQTEYTPRSLILTGTVSNAADRSMTVVAQFAEELESLTGITSAQVERFTRLQSEDGAWFSPFTITITFEYDTI